MNFVVDEDVWYDVELSIKVNKNLAIRKFALVIM